MTEFRMPSLGADMESGFLREWRVKPGDKINRGDIIAEVETQKGIIEIEVFDDGVVGELLIGIDDKVPVGTLMTHILSPEEAKTGIQVAAAKTTIEEAPPAVKPSVEKAAVITPAHHLRASPLARKVAEQKGIDLARVTGTGPDGAITREDVEKATPPKPGPPSKKGVPENIRFAVAAAMSKSNREIPHYYLQTRVVMDHALGWLAETNKQRSVRDRLLPAVLYLKAVAKALGDVPDLNAWWENGLQPKQDVNIGFVVSLRGGGVIVPCIHDVGKKSLDDLMKSLSDIIPRTRLLKLRSSDLADSTITITSLGEGSVETVFGVIYPPQVALVGFGGIHEEPWAENGMLGTRQILGVSLAADHRASDGNTGNHFLAALKKCLSQPELL